MFSLFFLLIWIHHSLKAVVHFNIKSRRQRYEPLLKVYPHQRERVTGKKNRLLATSFEILLMLWREHEPKHLKIALLSDRITLINWSWSRKDFDCVALRNSFKIGFVFFSYLFICLYHYSISRSKIITGNYFIFLLWITIIVTDYLNRAKGSFLLNYTQCYFIAQFILRSCVPVT